MYSIDTTNYSESSTTLFPIENLSPWKRLYFNACGENIGNFVNDQILDADEMLFKSLKVMMYGWCTAIFGFTIGYGFNFLLRLIVAKICPKTENKDNSAFVELLVSNEIKNNIDNKKHSKCCCNCNKIKYCCNFSKIKCCCNCGKISKCIKIIYMVLSIFCHIILSFICIIRFWNLINKFNTEILNINYKSQEKVDCSFYISMLFFNYQEAFSTLILGSFTVIDACNYLVLFFGQIILYIIGVIWSFLLSISYQFRLLCSGRVSKAICPYCYAHWYYCYGWCYIFWSILVFFGIIFLLGFYLFIGLLAFFPILVIALGVIVIIFFLIASLISCCNMQIMDKIFDDMQENYNNQNENESFYFAFKILTYLTIIMGPLILILFIGATVWQSTSGLSSVCFAYNEYHKLMNHNDNYLIDIGSANYLYGAGWYTTSNAFTKFFHWLFVDIWSEIILLRNFFNIEIDKIFDIFSQYHVFEKAILTLKFILHFLACIV